jgi:hypothetical protein
MNGGRGSKTLQLLPPDRWAAVRLSARNWRNFFFRALRLGRRLWKIAAKFRGGVLWMPPEEPMK